MSERDIQDIGKRLAEAKPKGLTDRVWADTLGISRQTWSAYINGAAMPSFGVLRQIAVITGLNLDWLVFGQGPPQGLLNSSVLHTAIKGTLSLVESARKNGRDYALDDIVAMVAGLYEDMIKSSIDEQNSYVQGAEVPQPEGASHERNRKAGA